MTYYHEKCSQFKQNTKKLWGIINETIKKVKHRGSIMPDIMVNGIKVNKAKEIANSFGEFYSQLGSELVSKIVPGTTSIDDYMSCIPRQLNSFVMRSTAVPEIEQLINQMPNKSSHRNDEISNQMLKSLCKSISFPLCNIFNDSIRNGVFPDMMKQAEVIPLYKGKEMDVRINHRPISLLITISKILEEIVYNILFSSQYGFHKNHSCEHAILELISHIRQANNQGEQTASVFLDLSKAFDTSDHRILLSKLEQYGVRGIPSKWFRNYLTGRSLVAKVMMSPNTITYSEKFNISYGTAQGSCLGPLLFLVFVNDIHHLELYSRIILFVDDTTVFNSHKSPDFLRYTLFMTYTF